MTDTIQFEDFAKSDIRIGTVKEATVPEGSNKLIRQVVDFGEEIGEKIIFSGIKDWYSAEEMVGKQLPYGINLQLCMAMGEESQGMLMAAGSQEQNIAVLVQPDKKVESGTPVS